MTQTEIKKSLYKEKPKAVKLSTASGFVWYETRVKITDRFEPKRITFKIPEHEAQGFNQTEQSQLLIRWMQ